MARKCSAQRAEQAVGGFAAARKNIVIQYQGTERQQEEVLVRIREDMLAHGLRDEEIEKVDVYLKPEEQAVYYVANDSLNGKIPF